MDTVGVKETLPAGSPSPQAESDENLKYKMDYPEKSLCVIINMEKFSNDNGAEERKGSKKPVRCAEERKGSKKPVRCLERREGSDRDVKSIKDVFEEIGFTVKVLIDKTCQDLLDILKKVAEEDHSKRSCFVCVIMSHGEEGTFFGSDNESFEDNKLFELFNGQNCRSLVGKPKLFFLQKCEGKKRDPGVALHGSSKAIGTKIPTEADFLYHYATFPGNVAYRTSDGSWFVESLCNLLKEYWNKKDLLQILTLVNHKVATKYETSKEEKQMPCVVSTLRKSLYLY